MVNNSTNIKQTYNYLSPQTIEQKKDHDIYAKGNPGPGLGHAQKSDMIFWSTHSMQNVKSICNDRIGGVKVSVLAWSAVDRGFEHWSGLTKDYTIGICCFSA